MRGHPERAKIGYNKCSSRRPSRSLRLSRQRAPISGGLAASARQGEHLGNGVVHMAASEPKDDDEFVVLGQAVEDP